MVPADEVREFAGERLLTRSDLSHLAQIRGLCVSLFVPLRTAGRDVRENPIRLKNRIGDARRQLLEAGLGRDETNELLQPAVDLVNGLGGDRALRGHQREGLALFLAPGERHHFRLPLELRELSVVGRHFHLKPLIPMLMGDGRFFILAVSLGSVRLLEASRHHIRELDPARLEGVPTSLKEALRFDVVQTYLGARDVSPGPPGTETRYHGHGGGEDKRKEKILGYFQQLAQGIQNLLKDDQAPMVFAGVDYLFPLYQRANRHPQLMPEAVTGNPDDWSADELHERAWPLVRPHFEQAQERALRRFEQANDDRSSSDLEHILAAAFEGRVDTLLTALGIQRWGTFDPGDRTLRLDETATADNEDLLNLVAVQTLVHGGTVYTFEPERMPDGVPVAASYRF